MLKVMIVDNEPVIRKGLSQCFDWEGMGCDVPILASDGLEALEKLKSTILDIVISDIRMPGMDGLSLANTIMQQYPQTKVIILTGYSEFEYAQQAVRYRVADFLLKPVNEEKLHSAIQHAKALLMDENKLEQLNHALNQKEQENLLLEQNLFLQNMLKNQNPSTLLVLEQSARLKLDFSAFYVLNLSTLTPDNAPASLSDSCIQDAIRFLPYVFSSDLLRVLPREGDQFFFFFFSNVTGVLHDQLAEYTHMIESMTEYSVRIGVSHLCSDAFSIANAAQQALDARHYLSIDDSKAFLFYDDIPAPNVASQEKLLSLLRQLNIALKKQSRSETRKVLLSFEELVRVKVLTLSDVRSFVAAAYNLCVSILLNFNMESTIIENKLLSLDQIYSTITPQNITRSLLRVTDQVFHYLNGSLTETDRLIRFVCDYIQANYVDDLSLEQLARVSHLSPSYLSRLFKTHTGKNISNYIQSVRMEAAKAMLESTDQKTYEIAKAIGIDDPVYFSRLFKKVTGLKPTDYRKHLSKSKE